eukprot:scaffold2954_cov171-Amphora_coffeaeformis.AAC.7
MARTKKTARMGKAKKDATPQSPSQQNGNSSNNPSRAQRKQFAAELRAVSGKSKAPKKVSNKKKMAPPPSAALEWLTSPKKAPHANNNASSSAGPKSDKKKKKDKTTEKKKVPFLNPVTKFKMSKKVETKKEAKKKAAEAAKKNGNNGKQQQQTQLPAKRTGQGRIPWMASMMNGIAEKPVTIDLPTPGTIDLTAGNRDVSPNYSNKRFRLPTDDSDPVLLARFSEELRAFGEYIRLTPAECEARNAVLEQMHNIAVRVFQNSPEINVNDLELQVFGSYACRDVSTFRSDVDVALWGAVFPKLSYQRRIAKVSDKKKEATTEVDPKTKKLQKWLALIDESNAMTPDRHHHEEKRQPKTETEKSDDQPTTGDVATGDEKDGKQRGDDPKDPTGEQPAEETEMPLFVLDRTGVEIAAEQPLLHDDTTKSQAPASVSTQATAAESESSVEGDTKKVDKGEENDSSDDDTVDKLTESRKASVSRASSQAEAADFSRRKVIDGLQRFFRGLRNSGLTKNIQLISRARVPIIKMETLLGVEIDCSIGGMNGADTSLYALKMTQKYQSFAPVVLALKVIMGQQNLDTPFNGGLGSYKLYVLVASHIAKHVEMGGRDDPGEIFLSFVFRYGDSIGHHHTHRETRSFLSKEDVISCRHGGNADLSNVFLIQECRGLFGSLWKRLWGLLRKAGKPVSEASPRVSFLAEVIHTTWLDHGRQTNISNAKMFLKERERQNTKGPNRNPPAKRKGSPAVASAVHQNRDLTEAELIASYRGQVAKKARAS